MVLMQLILLPQMPVRSELQLIIEQDEETGKYIMTIPGKNEAVHPLVVPNDTGKFADLLVKTAAGKNLLACNEMTDYVSYAKVWSEVSGVPCEVKEVSLDDWSNAAPGGLGREAGESISCSSEFGWGEREGTLVLPWEVRKCFPDTSLQCTDSINSLIPTSSLLACGNTLKVRTGRHSLRSKRTKVGLDG